MDANALAQHLYPVFKSQLGQSPTIEDAEKILSASDISVQSPEVYQLLMEKFRAEFAPPAAIADAAPRLLVAWGEMPRVGAQVRPEFTLLCSAYDSRPEVRVTVDRELDHDPDDVRRRPQSDEPGLWTFHVPFRMTSGGLDCRPGQYLLDVEVSFRDVPIELPRFYRCRIRLTVPNANSSEGGVLEIAGDGQSVVNLQGYNLKQFSKVILKGGQDSIINLQNALGQEAPSSSAAADKPVTAFEYQLKIDQQRQSRLPKLGASSKPRAYLDAAGFYFEDGRRAIVMTRAKLTFGRSRDNDVVLRFLPTNEENDANSKNISRTHFIVQLTSEGLELVDESRSGLELNYSVVQKHQVIPASYAGDQIHLKLGVTGTVPKGFELELNLFASDRRETRDELEYWDEVYCEVVGGHRSRLARESLDVGINAVRYDRMGNLQGEETYVHLLREVLIGGSPVQSGILLRHNGPMVQARLLHIDRSFWLEPTPGGNPVVVDGEEIRPRTLLALSPGMEIRFGSEIVRFDRPSQLYLDSHGE